MLTQEMKGFLSKHKHQSSITTLIRTPDMWNAIIGIQGKEIAELFELTEREQLSLIPFPEQALIEALDHTHKLLSGKIPLRSPINNRVGWFLGLLKTYCAKHNITPDWLWYYQLCELLGHNPKEKDTHKPLVVNKSGSGVRLPGYSDPRLNRTHEEQVKQLEYDIANYKSYIAEPTKYFDMTGAYTLEIYIDLANHQLQLTQNQLAILNQVL